MKINRDIPATVFPFFLVLAPYSGIPFDGRMVLFVQAFVICLIVGLMALFGFATRDRPRRTQLVAPRILIGLGFYIVAAILGVIVALVRGNDPQLILGQAVSMLLLPAGAAAGFLSANHETWPHVRNGIVLGVGLGSLVHLIHWIVSAVQGDVLWRMYFPHFISIQGTALLGLLLVLSMALASHSKLTFPLVATALLIFLFIVGSGTRSLWLVTIAAILTLFACFARQIQLSRFLVSGVLAAAILALPVVTTVGVDLWAISRSGNVLPSNNPAEFPLVRLSSMLRLNPAAVQDADNGGLEWKASIDKRSVVVSMPMPVHSAGSYELRVVARRKGSRSGSVGLQWLDKSGRNLGYLRAFDRSHGEWTMLRQVSTPPRGTTACRLILALGPGRDAQWEVRRIELVRLGPAALSPIIRYARHLIRRAGSILGGDVPGTLRLRKSIDLRFLETTRLVRRFAQSQPQTKILGHGLGATYATPHSSPKHGQSLNAPAQINYIHNYYVFLLFKIGILGFLLVGSALLLWMVDCSIRARHSFPILEKSFPLAIAVALASYAVWSLACPGFLDFRVAPIWGLVLAAVSQTGRNEG